MRRATLALLLCVACERKPTAGIDASPPPIEASTVDASSPSWADFPPTAEAARALVDRFTKRPTDGHLAPLEAPAILGRIDAWVERGAPSDGVVEEKLRARLKRSDDARRASVLLVGSAHDAPAHVEAFRRLVAPSSALAFDVVAFEQLAADGHWGLAPAPQVGDTALVDVWSASGSARALAEGHAKRDYAAWKFGYLDNVVEAMISARAAGARVLPCDMPESLQRGLGAARELWLGRMRELHCALTLRDAERSAPTGPDRPRHTAVFIGAAHVEPDGLPRMMAPADDVTTVRLVGGRIFVRDLDDAIAKRYQLAMPLLVAMDDAGKDHVLVVADPVVQGRIETVRENDTQAAGPPRVEIIVASRAGIAASLRFVGVRDPIVASAGSRQVVSLPAGRHVAILGRAPPFVVFPVDVPSAGFTEIALGDRIGIAIRERR